MHVFVLEPFLAYFIPILLSLVIRYFKDVMDLFMYDQDDPLSPSQAAFDLSTTIREEDDDSASPIQVKYSHCHESHLLIT